MDPTIQMAIKLSFKVYWHYDKMVELSKKLGLERKLKEDGINVEFVPGMHPRIEFELWNADRRAIFLFSEPSEDNSYSILLPDNRLLYSKLYKLLKDHNLEVKARMVELTGTGIPQSNYNLLLRY